MEEAWSTPILHVDMDAFFVEVERRLRPDLRGLPVIVGGLGRRGVVASCSYEARARGVHSAMPMAQARRLCPQAEFIPPTMARYQEYSVKVFTVLRSFTHRVEPLSVDEAFLDVTGLRLHHADPQAVAVAIRKRIREELELPASVGIAPNKFLAKLASDRAKPDGLFSVAAQQVRQFLDPLPVRALWGVGEATHAALEGLGVETVGDLEAVPLAALTTRLGPAVAQHLEALARGEDPRRVEPGGDAKSMSVEQTFAHDISGRSRVEAELLAQSDRVATRLRSAGVAARTIAIKVRYAPFETITRSVTPGTAVDTARDIYRLTRELVGRVEVDRPIRLIGVAASQLVDNDQPRQLGLLEPGQVEVAPDGSGAWGDLADAVEDVRNRFGDRAVGPARLAGAPDVSDPDRMYGPGG